MAISLSTIQIDIALPKIEKGLRQYLYLQSRVTGPWRFVVSQDAKFRRKFNYFYRIRRSTVWQNEFYKLMARANSEQLQFHAVLDLLRGATNRYEASFASKLIATLKPSMPIIDSNVLKNTKLRLPVIDAVNRAQQICEIYRMLADLF